MERRSERGTRTGSRKEQNKVRKKNECDIVEQIREGETRATSRDEGGPREPMSGAPLTEAGSKPCLKGLSVSTVKPNHCLFVKQFDLCN